MSSLQDKFISETYTGLLHSDGILPSSGQTIIYDGSGNTSALIVGRSGNGATVSGQLSASSLTVGNIAYPTVAGSIGSIVVQTTSSGLGLISKLPYSYLEDLDPSPKGTYTSIDYIKVNSKGLITDIREINADGLDPKLISKLQFNSNPAIAVATNFNIYGDSDWKNGLSLKGSVPKGTKTVLLTLIPSNNIAFHKDNDPSKATRTIKIRASRNPYNNTGGYLYDPTGHHVLWFRGGYGIGVQAHVCIGDDNNNDTGDPRVWFMDQGTYVNGVSGGDGPEASFTEWDIYVEAWGY